MVLLVTNRDDLTADWLVLELERREVQFVRFNTEDYPADVTLCWTPDGSSLRLHGKVVDGEQIRAVWWRRPLPPQLPPGRPDGEAGWAAGEALAALDGFWRTVEARWVNPPRCNAAAGSKQEQLSRAQKFGFGIPETLVTNDPQIARHFLTEHRIAICKSLSSSRVPHGSSSFLMYTSRIAAEDLDDETAFGPEPYLLQTLVTKKYDVRVTVIGSTAYACRIESQGIAESSVDWRRGDVTRLPHAVEPLPDEVAAQCVAYARSYGLRFAAIDLARTPEGDYIFFELNPNGQWAWVEQLTGLPLAAKLADELMTAP